ncbi:hypothetical protein CAPTEDRAFT_161693 [Capitella teleta]|uniref:Major facilitator superfamily (MFS) profile domain-containing protein n=1 Tax=Capitella teleta TaxID=283909 RepID=N1PBE6_CAPTE|nr:hypothetical protein CAPTEDRAFT_161693 [Capitella teleta]|eukprot:ELU18919.1 hypothetical protein CAPTEDRAFT_161693 [Capitella teleta]
MSVMGMFQFGYNTTVINAPDGLIKAFFNESHLNRYGTPMPEATIDILWSVAVAITAVGGCIGGLLGAEWANRLGRKRGMFFNTFSGLVAALLMSLSKPAHSYEMLIIGRLVIGFHCGLYTGLVPVYNAEVSPPSIRGSVGTINQLAVTLGLLIAQVLGLQDTLGTAELWPVLLGLAAFAPVVQIIGLSFCPESPRYLLLSMQEEVAAVQSLKDLRCGSDVQAELTEMYKEQQSNSDLDEHKVGVLGLLKDPSLRMPLLVAVVMHLSQQLSGINCIFYYSSALFERIGLSVVDANYASLAVGGIMVVMTIVSIPLMDRAGRRALHLVGLAGMFFSSIVFTVCFNVAVKATEKNRTLEVTSIVFALMIVVFFAIGPGSIPWMIVAELFSQGPRTSAVAVGVVVNWLSNFAVGISFISLLNATGELVFVPFTCFLFVFFVFLWCFLPETKGKTFEEISALFNKH